MTEKELAELVASFRRGWLDLPCFASHDANAHKEGREAYERAMGRATWQYRTELLRQLDLKQLEIFKLVHAKITEMFSADAAATLTIEVYRDPECGVWEANIATHFTQERWPIDGDKPNWASTEVSGEIHEWFDKQPNPYGFDFRLW